MAVDFPSNAVEPSYGSKPQVEFRILSADFGEGYTQRVGDGLNTKIEKWDMTWNNLTTGEKDVIINFLDAREGAEAFNFTMPGKSSSEKWICNRYQATPTNPSFFSISAEFEKVYDV